MNAFEFVFSLFGLLLGLGLASTLGGLARALKSRHRLRIGWLTSLLGLFVSLDLVTFWSFAWAIRDQVPVTWPALFFGFVVTGLYFLAASLIFPDEPEEWQDLDAHFFLHRRQVLAGVLICNIIVFGLSIVLLGLPASAFSVRNLIIQWGFFPLLVVATVAKRRAVILVALAILLLLNPLAVFWR